MNLKIIIDYLTHGNDNYYLFISGSVGFGPSMYTGSDDLVLISFLLDYNN